MTNDSDEVIHIYMAAIFSFIVPGIGQAAFLRQPAKGMLVCFLALVGLIVIGCAIDETPQTYMCVTSSLAAIDAIVIGRRLKTGRNVQKWEFFWDA